MNVSFPPEVTPKCTDIKESRRCEQTDTDDEGL